MNRPQAGLMELQQISDDIDTMKALTATDEASDPVAAVRAKTDAATAANFDFLSLWTSGYDNEFYRIYAVREAVNGDWAHAARLFEIAAKYADKYSQHRLSLLYWHGVGVEKDRTAAYIWADMAAERGYPQLLAIREKMWAALTPAQQDEVRTRGPKVYAVYGDVAALPRQRGLLQRKRSQITGSRAGFIGNLTLRTGIPQPLWRLQYDTYIAREESAWKKVTVEVGEVESSSGTADAPVAPAATEKDGESSGTPPPKR